MRFRVFILALLAASTSAAATNPAAAINFDRQIRPILSDNCFTCHGPDEKHRMAGLHFDTKDGAFSKPGVIVPGKSADSKMYWRISNPNAALRMPPTYSGRKLTPDQIQLIKTWIDSGAKWETHWAFVAPKQAALPPVRNSNWARNPIDRFVLAKLEAEGLQPAPEADKITLLRRVTFDLTGLPPTQSESAAFLGDKSPHAYEKLVDRLLASPHYGERMAMQWLDFARYADTHGYHIDSAREMWIWRDWVIQAFNANMPYDEFTVEQLAGDLLPNATQSQIIATGFNRNHMINFEGGAIPEEYQNEYIVDRIEATSTTWLGITLGCARCHDHKYDPLRQKDFYSFGAFFNGIKEKGLDGYKGNAVPFLQMPNPEQADMKSRLLAAIKTEDAQVAAAQSTWEQSQRAVSAVDVTQGLNERFAFDNSLSNAQVTEGKLPFTAGRLGQAADFSDEPHVLLPLATLFDSAKPMSIAMWVKPDGPSGMELLQRYKQSPKAGAGYEIAIDYCNKNNCNIIVRMQDKGADSGLEARSVEGLTLEQWNHLLVSYDGSGQAKGIQIIVNGRPVRTIAVRDRLSRISLDSGALEIGNKSWGNAFKGQLADVRFYSRRVYPTEAVEMAVLNPALIISRITPEKRTEDEVQWLRAYFLREIGNPSEKQSGNDRATLQRGLDQLNHEIPSTMVMAEMDKPRDTYILARGDYRNRGEKVEPNTPAVLPPLPKDAPRNRLTLARWIVDPSNPLTARVAVNHFWQMYFNIGLVKTSEDFGSQGDPPSNAELLDWLAVQFMESKWDVKAMQRLIVTSAAYRQSSAVDPALLEKDPENRLLAHGPRFRLPAEMLRDNALSVSGLLNSKIGGPSVLPYQPKGLWEEMAFGGDFSAQTYVQSHGADLYRRSIYTFWKRSVPYPSLNNFDAPDREKCTARRGTTNTPLQALTLMNDPTFVEAARGLAERDLHHAGSSTADRIRFAFRSATGRDPSTREFEILSGLYKTEIAHYDRDRSAAAKLLSVGESPRNPKDDVAELAAWTLVSSTILNMDESITIN